MYKSWIVVGKGWNYAGSWEGGYLKLGKQILNGYKPEGFLTII